MRFKRLVYVCILAGACLSLSPDGYRPVRFVYDGDTILLDGGQKVRFLGINAPELGRNGQKDELMARAAWKFTCGLLNRSQVKLEYDRERKDRHGRILAYVFLENGDMVNATLVRKGLAHVMFQHPNLQYKDLLLDCQQKAIKEKLGMWSHKTKADEAFFVGNLDSYRFHRPSCPFGKEIRKKNRIRFYSRQDAFWAGFSPCRRCQP